jgi:hypothetical protein
METRRLTSLEVLFGIGDDEARQFFARTLDLVVTLYTERQYKEADDLFVPLYRVACQMHQILERHDWQAEHALWA